MGETFELKPEYQKPTTPSGGNPQMKPGDTSENGQQGNNAIKNLHIQQPKVESPEEIAAKLAAEKQAAIDAAKTAEPPKPADTTDKPVDKTESENLILIGKREYTEEELAAVIEEANKHYGYDVSQLPEEIMVKVIEDRINLKEASRTANQRSQTIAEDRRANEAEKTELAAQNAELTARQQEIARRESELNELIKKNKELLKRDPDGELTDRDALSLITEQKFAEKENTTLQAELAEIQTSKKDIEGKFVVNYTLGLIDELQRAYPELKTQEEVLDVMEKVFAGKKPANQEDIAKSSIVAEVIREYGSSTASGAKLKITDFYEFYKHKFPNLTSEKPAAQTEKKTLQEFKAGKARDIVKDLINRQKVTPATSAGSGANSTVNEYSAKSNTREKIAKEINKRYKG